MSFLRDAKHRADGAMLLVTVFWGLTFPLIRSAVQDLSPQVFVATRFWMGAALFVPLVLASPSARRGLKAAVLPGAVLGLVAWGSYVSQTIGLQTVGAGRAAFVTGTNVILVPFLSPLFRAGRPRPIEYGAAVVALAGMYLLTDPRGGGLGPGDLWVFACAVLYAVYIHVLQIFLRRRPEPLALAFTQVVGVAVPATLGLLLSGETLTGFTAAAWRGLLFCATAATVGTFWLQTRFQGRTTPQRVALIFAMEPVFATVFAALLLGESLAAAGRVGAALILVSVLGVEVWDRPVVRRGRKAPPA